MVFSGFCPKAMSSSAAITLTISEPSEGPRPPLVGHQPVRQARHATRITVDVTDEGEQVRLVVRDDGDASTSAQNSSGYGLVGMAERATLLGGSLRADPGTGGGVDGRP